MNKSQAKMDEHLQEVIAAARDSFNAAIQAMTDNKSRLVFIRENYLPIVSALSEAIRNIND